MPADYGMRERTRRLPSAPWRPMSLKRRVLGVFRITDEGTGEEVQVFDPATFAKGANGALYAAARRAAALQREGQTVILTGPEGFQTRRYDPAYLQAAAGGRWPYRVPCSVADCPNWVHPRNRTEAPLCRENASPRRLTTMPAEAP